MIDEEVEAGWLLLIGIITVHLLEIITCLIRLHENSRAKKVLITYNILSIISIYLLIILLRGGRSLILNIMLNCNSVLALYGIVWAGNMLCFVKLIEHVQENKQSYDS